MKTKKDITVRLEYRDNFPVLVYYLDGKKDFELSKEGFKKY